MRRQAILVLLPLAGAVLVAACSSFSSDDPPVAIDTPDAAADVPTDTTGTEGMQADAQPLSDGAPSPFCADAGAHALCEDFDEGSLAANGWGPGQQSTPDAGVAQIDEAQFTSMPSSLLVGLSTIGFTVQRSFFVHHNIAGAAARNVVLSFDLYVDDLERVDGGSADSLVASIGDGAYANEIRVTTNGGLISVNLTEVFTGAYYGPIFTFGGHTFPTKQWHRFVLTSNRKNNKLAISIDGSEGTTAAATFHVPSSMATNLGLDLGSQTDTHDESIKLYYDNVTLDLDSF
jgi:hypothetical protein